MSSGMDIGALMAQMGGGGGAPQGAPQGPPPQDEGAGDTVPSLLQQAIDALHKAFGAETEPIDKEMISKALLAVQAILANEQKEKNQALGGSGARMLGRNRS